MKVLESHQSDAVVRALKYDGFNIYHEQGTGKTLTSLHVVLARYNDDDLRKLLICGPLSAIDVWEKELASVPELDYDILKLEDKSERKEFRLPQRSNSKLRIVTVNYEILGRNRKLVKKLEKWAPDMTIADEIHRLKKRTAKQAKAMHKIGDASRFRIGCSGTPVEQAGLDLWSQYRFTCPDVLGVWEAFRSHYLRETGYGYTKLVVRKQFEAELNILIHSRMDRVTKEEVLDLPKMKRRNIRFTLPERSRELYQSLEDDAVAMIDKENGIATPNVLAKLVRCQQLTSGYLPNEEGELFWLHERKLRIVKRLLEKRLDRKTVIFTRGIPELEQLIEIGEDLGLEPAWLRGKMKRGVKLDERQRFYEDPNCGLIVCQVRTGGVGINEFVVADQVIFYSTTFSWIDYDQAVCRLHRRGQTKVVEVVHLIAKRSTDEELFARLKEKQGVAKMVLDLRERHG